MTRLILAMIGQVEAITEWVIRDGSSGPLSDAELAALTKTFHRAHQRMTAEQARRRQTNVARLMRNLDRREPA